MKKSKALSRLAELRAAREAGLVEEWECRNRAAAILNRSRLKPLDLTDYLAETGFEGHALARAVGPFGTLMKALYRDKHGADPLMRHTMIRGQMVGVYAYIEDDRPLADAAFSALFSAVSR